MSPSEDQLRAALRHGQGPGISADRIIAQAREIRHQRRVRYGSAFAVAAAVAGIGVGGGFLVTSTGSSSVKGAIGSKATVNGAAKGAASGSFAAPAGNAGAAAGLACPATLPTLTVPSRGTGPLFDAPVSAMTLCLYPPGGGAILTSHGSPLRTVLTGSAATTLASSIESAPVVAQTDPCPLYRSAAGKTLLIIGERADGTAMAPVETQVDQNPCNQPIMNGTAVRYNWSPPSSLSAFLTQAGAPAPAHQPVTSTTPLEQGSPIRS